MLKNHGLVTTGKDFWEALNIAEEIDEAARVYVLTAGKAPPIPREDIDRIKSLGISELSQNITLRFNGHISMN